MSEQPIIILHGSCAMDLFNVDDDSYAVDHTNMSPAEFEESSVVVPEPRFDISLSDLADLQISTQWQTVKTMPLSCMNLLFRYGAKTLCVT